MSTVAAAAVVAAETELTYSLAYTEGKQAKSNKFSLRPSHPLCGIAFLSQLIPL